MLPGDGAEVQVQQSRREQGTEICAQAWPSFLLKGEEPAGETTKSCRDSPFTPTALWVQWEKGQGVWDDLAEFGKVQWHWESPTSLKLSPQMAKCRVQVLGQSPSRRQAGTQQGQWIPMRGSVQRHSSHEMAFLPDWTSGFSWHHISGRWHTTTPSLELHLSFPQIQVLLLSSTSFRLPRSCRAPAPALTCWGSQAHCCEKDLITFWNPFSESPQCWLTLAVVWARLWAQHSFKIKELVELIYHLDFCTHCWGLPHSWHTELFNLGELDLSRDREH